MSKPRLMVYDRICPLCEGYGVRIEWIAEYARSRRCTSCDGTGKVPRVYGWRPYEPGKENSGGEADRAVREYLSKRGIKL